MRSPIKTPNVELGVVNFGVALGVVWFGKFEKRSGVVWCGLVLLDWRLVWCGVVW
jgi:hypothetical protein